MKIPQRIADKIVSDDTGCWLWSGRLDENGYGSDVRWNGLRQRAHIIVYKITKGTYEEGLELDHLCRVRCCVNPDHLEPVTKQINISRGLTGKQNHRNSLKTHCKRGHEFNEVNTHIRKKGERLCRRCEADRMSEVYRTKGKK